MIQKRARKGGEYGANGEWYEGGKFIATSERTKKRKPVKSSRKQEIDSFKWETHENPDAIAIYPQLSGIEIRNSDGAFELNTKLNGRAMGWSDSHEIERQEKIDAFNDGFRWIIQGSFEK